MQQCIACCTLHFNSRRTGKAIRRIQFGFYVFNRRKREMAYLPKLFKIPSDVIYCRGSGQSSNKQLLCPCYHLQHETNHIVCLIWTIVIICLAEISTAEHWQITGKNPPMIQHSNENGSSHQCIATAAIKEKIKRRSLENNRSMAVLATYWSLAIDHWCLTNGA